MATRFADIQPPQQPDKRDDRKSIAEKARAIAERLGKEADDRVSRRTVVEQRWLDDMRQYHGKYDDAIAADLTKSKRSALFINYTRAKTNAAEARLWDMLFPTDDKNWGIGPTPVPRLHDSAKRATEGAKALTEKANEALAQGNAQGAQQIAGIADQAAQSSHQAKADMEEAKKRAQAMEAEMEDQLRECGYQMECRKTIHDACVLGTGVLKGPIGSDKMPYGRRSWTKGEGNDYELANVADHRPAFRWVDLWSFFWDPDARNQDESESDYERHLMTPKDLRKLARQPGFDKEAIRRLLMKKPDGNAPSYLTDMRALTGADQSQMGDRYHVWEYHGCLTAEEIRDLCACLESSTSVHFKKEDEQVDPLEELRVIVWFCEGEVLRFGPHPMESGDSLYRVFNYEKDEASIAGFGVPSLMRDPQRAMNAAWRMMMDNAGLTTGPQLIIDLGIIEPASDGDYTMKPLKVWLRKSGAPAGKPGIEAININGHTEELAAIIEMCKQFVDDVTNIPVIAQGEQGTHTTQTAQGMTILMNSVNVVFRRTVKNWDDDITVPTITGLYDWNMQFSDREEIKGDMEVDARGSSVLLVREMQSQNLGIMIAQSTQNPIILPMMKIPPMLRRWVQSFMLKADEFVKTDDEMQAEAAAQQGQPPSPDQIKLEIAKLGSQTQLQLAEMTRETEMIKLAQGGNITVEQIAADLAKSREKIMSDERKFAAELAFEKANPDNGGSGGFVSAGPGGQADTGQGEPE